MTEPVLIRRAIVAPAKAGAQGEGAASGHTLSLDPGSSLRYVRDDGNTGEVPA
jgi:hypothetical protein